MRRDLQRERASAECNTGCASPFEAIQNNHQVLAVRDWARLHVENTGHSVTVVETTLERYET